MEWGWGFRFVDQSSKPMVGSCQLRPHIHTDRTLKSTYLRPKWTISEKSWRIFPRKRGDVRFGSKADMCSAMAYVRFGSKADMCSAMAYVRFAPESGHLQCTRPCLLWASSRHSGAVRVTPVAQLRRGTLTSTAE